MTSRSKAALGRLARVTYWLTRDSDPDTGAPSAYVDVWWSRPVRYPVGERGSFWLDPISVTGLGERYGVWTVETAAQLGIYPDDGIMCIRVGPEIRPREAST